MTTAFVQKLESRSVGLENTRMRHHTLLPIQQVGLAFCTYLVRTSENVHSLLSLFCLIFVSRKRWSYFLSIGWFSWFFHIACCCLLLIIFTVSFFHVSLLANKVYAQRPHGGCIIPVVSRKRGSYCILLFISTEYLKVRFVYYECNSHIVSKHGLDD